MWTRMILGVIASVSFVGVRAAAETVTVTIAGVIVDQDDVRRGDIRVRLFGGGELTTDLSRRNGVYNLSEPSVDSETNTLLVRCTDPRFDETALEVTFEDASRGIKRAKANDLKLHSKATSSDPTKSDEEKVQEAAPRVANARQTEALKVKWNLASRAEARRNLVSKIAGIAAAYPGLDEPENFAAVVEASKHYMDSDVNAAVLMTDDRIRELPGDGVFKQKLRTERLRLRRAHEKFDSTLKGEQPIDDEMLEKILTIPASDIKLDWLTKHNAMDRIPSIVSDYGRGPNRDVFGSNVLRAPAEVKTWLRGSPLRKRFLLYEQLLRDPDLSAAQKRKIRNYAGQLTPVLRAVK